MTQADRSVGALRPAPGLLSGIRAATRHELRLLLFSPLTPVFQAGFLLVLSACIFLVSDYYNADEASLGSFSAYLPLVALVFVPALAMRAWPRDLDDRSVELTLTLPWPAAALVLGKFLAGSALLLVTLAFTLALPLTALYLGRPDLGRMAAGYLGAALLLVTLYALALFAAALAREAVAAFVAGIALLGALQLLGWDFLGRSLESLLPPAVLGALPQLSPARHLAAFDRGLVDAGSLLALLLTALAALAGTAVVVVTLHRRGPLRRRAAGAGAILAIALAALVAIPAVQRSPWSADLTDEGDYSLSDGTREILAELPPGVAVTLYWSDGQGNVPTYIKSHARRVRGLLHAMARAAGPGLRIAEIDPAPDTRPELDAVAAGLQRVPMSSGDWFFLGASVTDGERLGRIPYLDPARADFLEYDLAVALEALTRPRTPRLGILSPLLPPEAAQSGLEGLSVLAELRRSYDLAVMPFFTEEIPADLDVLLLVAPSVLKTRSLLAIDQYLMAGGSLIVLIDPFMRVDPGGNVFSTTPSAAVDDISDLLSAYGIGYDGQTVVGDLEAAAPVVDRSQAELLYPYWLRLTRDNLAPPHPATGAIHELLLAEPGALRLDAGAGAKPLLVSGRRSGVAPRSAFETATPRELAARFEADERPRVLAAAAQGRFESAFAAREDTLPDSASRPLLRDSTAPGLLIVVADVDWIFDAFSRQAVGDGAGAGSRPLNDNRALLLNLIGFASGDRSLLSIRTGARRSRSFTRVEALARAAREHLGDEEAALVRQVAEIERRVAGEGATAAPRSAESQAKLLEARGALRELRRQLREAVDRLGRRVKLFNLAAGPLLALSLALLVLTLRRGREEGRGR